MQNQVSLEHVYDDRQAWVHVHPVDVERHAIRVEVDDEDAAASTYECVIKALNEAGFRFRC